MSDTGEMASVSESTAKATPSEAVAELLRTHPSKPAPVASPMLRAALGFEAPADEAAAAPGYAEIADDRDAMSPARGIMVGLAVMLPFWGLVGFAIRAVLR